MSQFGLKTDPDSGKFSGYQWSDKEQKPAGNLKIYPSSEMESRPGLKTYQDPFDDLETLADRDPRFPSPRVGFEDQFRGDFENLRLRSDVRKPWQSPSRKPFEPSYRP